MAILIQSSTSINQSILCSILAIYVDLWYLDSSFAELWPELLAREHTNLLLPVERIDLQLSKQHWCYVSNICCKWLSRLKSLNRTCRSWNKIEDMTADISGQDNGQQQQRSELCIMPINCWSVTLEIISFHLSLSINVSLYV